MPVTNVLLTGTRQVGKTTACQAVAELARTHGYRLQGVLTPALHDGNGAKIGFEALDLGSDQRWLLALTEQGLGSSEFCAPGRSVTGPATGHGPVVSEGLDLLGLDGPQIGPYAFDAVGLARAIEVLRRACALPGDLLIVDEIGPLELEHGQGFASVLKLLPLQGPGHVLIVVRPALLPALRRRLKQANFSIYTVTVGNRDILPSHIVQEIWPHENFKFQNPNLKS